VHSIFVVPGPRDGLQSWVGPNESRRFGLRLDVSVIQFKKQKKGV
jgi:hypothetical protein